ncbi:DAK2 domain-containing protein [Scatolibacter rhodanostii]|uniref:DAK2 domain-containing protein n=1 Tax=Scatolibacter rhodanostii TaxID=2014781 RepID=UPI000C0843A8|nr:DAK2 domain-containing protein [Scatolibacter rhodanostii]
MISGCQLRDAIISGSNNIIRSKKLVNDLNIFPVPDGDTGTNMSMTIGAAATAFAELSKDASAAEVAKKAASAMLRGARGNSGVILSLIFRGFSKGCADAEEASAETLVRSLEIGVEDAYQAVMNPTEGTMLTVARIAAERGRKAIALMDELNVVEIWDTICMGAEEALKATPDLLPVLKKAGVVDAGGKGLCLIFEGMMSVFKNNVMIESGLSEDEKKTETEEFFRNVAAEFDSEITFTYCTEFIVGRDSTILTNPSVLRKYLEGIGDCVVVVDDDEIIKVHVHTEDPGKALQKGLEFGSLLTIKIENMKEQHRKAGEENEAAKAKAETVSHQQTFEPKEPTKEVGFVVVSAGDGLKGLFMDLGCDNVVSGGQTMNPSTEDIVAAVLATPAKTVFVLPNNKNIILAAEQAIPMVTDRTLVVVPTKTIPQGISAMLAFDGEAEGEEAKKAMLAAAERVDTGLVTFAARDSEFGGRKIKQGDVMGLKNGKLDCVEKDAVSACVKIAKALTNKTTSFITLIYGEDVTEQEAEKAKQKISSRLKGDTEITVVNGGQPVYYFIISVESEPV